MLCVGRRYGWNSGGRMASAEGGVWEGCLLPSRLGGLGQRRELPQRSLGQSILAYFEHGKSSFCTCWCFEQSGAGNFETWQNLRGICTIVLTPNSGGLVPRPPHDLRPYDAVDQLIWMTSFAAAGGPRLWNRPSSSLRLVDNRGRFCRCLLKAHLFDECCMWHLVFRRRVQIFLFILTWLPIYGRRTAWYCHSRSIVYRPRSIAGLVKEHD